MVWKRVLQRVSSPEISVAKSRRQRRHFHFDRSNAFEDVGLKMCEPPYSSVGVLHLAVRCNPWNQSLAVALTIPQARQGPIHGRSSVESGFEPGTIRPHSQDLTTRPPQPLHMVDLQWNLASNLGPSGPETKTLPLGHCCIGDHKSNLSMA
ncbi:hypothetical protein AVEN_8925-1 [Araneus ventricosus]|uniref:Uncharacterized protein n=1 Tax=Araneus ventricosus TaxID=182803 RepID=A0A4Y2DFI0_ARAVE|nr:hypothetical protein AVEN_8925-1 [Araneus ventricosus]